MPGEPPAGERGPPYAFTAAYNRAVSDGRPLGVIAGSGFEALFGSEDRQRAVTSVGRFDYFRSSLGGVELVVVPRHGFDHSYPPHRVPSKAQLAGLVQLGVGRIVAMSAVGSSDERYGIGEIVIPEQFIDLTKSRVYTFYDDHAVHTDMSVPFCPQLRQELTRAAVTGGSPVIHDGGVYACTEGPRYETPAEIEMIRRLGGHLVGQSAGPEIALARELGVCYTLLTAVSNRAAGYQQRVDSRDILETVWGIGPALSDYLSVALPAAAGGGCRGPCADNDLEAGRLRSRLLDRFHR